MKRIFIIFSLLALTVFSAQAQEKIMVMGEITSKANDEPLNYVQVFAYNTVAEGRDAYNEAKTKIAEIRDQFPDAWVLVMQNS